MKFTNEKNIIIFEKGIAFILKICYVKSTNTIKMDFK